ncbi:peptidoglycan-recognition protein LE [Armigeres subalbatus]|uniref:Peptidoglycan recognition protein LE n=1 Tax=Armigeres subalbatus TaxID=124917 RepID=H2BNX6_ARMSU|nr:peptidoglycan recognition protein LE [Armigeres subalbatus]
MNPKENEAVRSDTPILVDEKCKQWVESSEFSAISDDVSSLCGRSTEFSSTVADSDVNSITDDIGNINIGKINRGHELKIVSNGGQTDINNTEILQNVFQGNSTQTFGNIQVENSNKVHVGNVTYVTGPIHIIHTSGNNLGSIQQFVTNATPLATKDAEQSVRSVSDATSGETEEEADSDEKVERNRDEIFLSNVSKKIIGRVLRIVDRRSWLAQPALEYKDLKTPVPYVVISHTATESADTQAGMVYMVRMIQCFHIESRRWNDIAYNFLVGNDGNAYEGRGWKRLGAHTLGYNSRAIGISFVGCYMNEVPADIALDACQALIQRGVEQGYIQPDYKLVAHCQCSATESPGRKLFEVLKTWPHWTADP